MKILLPSSIGSKIAVLFKEKRFNLKGMGGAVISRDLLRHIDPSFEACFLNESSTNP